MSEYVSKPSDRHGQSRAKKKPAPSSPEEWSQYWQAKGFPWRREPEIDAKRQEELSRRRATVPDIKKGIYPFKGMKLSRADVEWLLATHENGRGPVNWNDESQREREGLDLRGANLSQEDLGGLPLACTQGGMEREWIFATEEQRNMAAGGLEKAKLGGAQLQGASLRGAQLQGAKLGGAQLQGAYLGEVHLQGAYLGWAQLQGADLREVQLQGANLVWAQLQGAFLREAQLQGANLYWTHLQGANLREVQLDGVRLNKAVLSDDKNGPVLLADVNWGEVNLAVVDWTPVKRLGDEHLAHKTKELDDYRAAVRANRQLAVVLQDQGLNEEAARFAYRAKVLERKVFWYQVRGGQVRQLGAYLFSWFLALLTGYGNRVWRIFVAYGLLIGLFATIYYFSPGSGHHLMWDQALVVSITAFHGRTYAGQYGPDTVLGGVAALEGIFGLVIEGVFIAMLVQRFFGR